MSMLLRACTLAMCGIAVTGCSGESSIGEPDPLKLGGAGPGGGVIFAFTGVENESGLEVFPNAIGQGAWGCAGVSVDDANSTRPTNGIGVPTGADSSELLFEAIAGGVCFSEAAELVTEFTNNGFSDWYLPSTDELISIRDLGLLPGQPGEVFWSATEDSAQNAFTVLIEVDTNELDSGEPSTTNKAVVANIIPVRAF
jgi:hypothetical protein